MIKKCENKKIAKLMKVATSKIFSGKFLENLLYFIHKPSEYYATLTFVIYIFWKRIHFHIRLFAHSFTIEIRMWQNNFVDWQYNYFDFLTPKSDRILDFDSWPHPSKAFKLMCEYFLWIIVSPYKLWVFRWLKLDIL